MGRIFRDRPTRVAGVGHFDAAAFASLWRPQGSLSRLGGHGGFGFRLGSQTEGWLLHTEVDFRLGDTHIPYTVGRGQAVVTTNNFESIYVGLGRGLRLLGN